MKRDVVKLIEKGVKLAYKRMLEEKAKNDEYIVISKDGKIIRLKAKTALSQLKRKKEL